VKQIILAITGASGAAYAQRLAQQLVAADVHLHLVISPHGRQLLYEELGLTSGDAASLLGRTAPNVTDYPWRDVGARLASGSFLTDGMIVCPCSTNTLGAIAGGLGDNLIHRAAAVTLKESRRLILVPREMPLSPVDLGNALRLSQAGAVICPACPGFYLRPTTVAELVDFVVGKLLDLLAVPHALHTRWQPPAAPTPEA
jgi:4-hydroxy-3-polyprenylbenzoate decarboxylase